MMSGHQLNCLSGFNSLLKTVKKKKEKKEKVSDREITENYRVKEVMLGNVFQRVLVK